MFLFQNQNIILFLWRFLQNKMQSARVDSWKQGSLIYQQAPKSNPKRYDIIKYSTWRMRLYQELESMSQQELSKKKNIALDFIFPKLCSTAQQKQFFNQFLSQMSSSHQQQMISHFICRMLYSRDLKNHEFFIKCQRILLSMKLQTILQARSKMSILKHSISSLTSIPYKQLFVSHQQFIQNEAQITKWNRGQNPNEHFFMKIPFEFGEAGLRRRKCFISKGFVYADVETATDILVTLFCAFLREDLMKTRIHTEKVLENDVENQLKPFMDKAINSINTNTIDQSQINSQFKLNLKNIDAVSKKYFPPCMNILNKKLKENNHLKHQGRRQLWLFFKGCGMDVHDNRAYFSKYFSLKVSNSDLKNHMYNIEHAYGLVGKKQPQRPKMCRAIITGAQPKKDQYHGCPFRHWSREVLKDYLYNNYSLNQQQMTQILSNKDNNYYQVACGRLFQANNKPQLGNLPEEITKELGKSPHQYFIAGMETAQWINTKTLRPQKTKPLESNKMEVELEF